MSVAALYCFIASLSPSAPVPKVKPPYTLDLIANIETSSPLDDLYSIITITNHTKDKLEVVGITRQLSSFVDFIVLDENGVRVTQPFATRMLESVSGGDQRVVATIDANDCIKIYGGMWAGKIKYKIPPGKYTCQVQFKYKEIDILSEKIEFTVNQNDIDLYKKAHGIK
jgi:hypothetical protein